MDFTYSHFSRPLSAMRMSLLSCIPEVFVKFINPCLLFILVCLSIPPRVSALETLEIGIVDLNRAINESEEGIRSRNLLEEEGRRMQQELNLEEEALRNQAVKLRENLLLTETAKKEKEAELKQQEQALIQKGQQFEQSLRSKERQMTNQMINELKAVIRTVARNGKFDVVLEKTTSEIILYIRNEITDLTEEVIDHYNSLKTPVKE